MLQECLTALSSAVGMPPPSCRGDGSCRVCFEADLDCVFTPLGSTVAVSAPLAALPASSSERRELLRAVLRASLGLMAESDPGSFTFPTLDREGKLTLEARLSGEPRSFVRGVEAFLNALETWRLAIRGNSAPGAMLNPFMLRG